VVEKQTSRPEIAPQKKGIKFAPAIGDWTVYKPSRVLVKKVKTGLYGFDRLSKDELNELLLIHYKFIKEFLKRLKIDLGVSAELFTVSVEQTTYLNFLRTLINPIVQAKINISEMHDPIHLFFDLAQANSMINHALGSQDLEPINRGLTESENNVFSTTISQYLPKLTNAFEHAISKPELKIIGSPDIVLDSSISPNLTLASFTAEIALADNPPGKIIFAYSGPALKNLLTRYRQIRLSKQLDFSKLSPTLLSLIQANVSIKLGETSLTTNDIHQLEVGDVVSLDTTIDSPISLTIGNALKSYAQAGIKSKKYSARIVGFEAGPRISIPKPELAEPEKEEPTPEEKITQEKDLPVESETIEEPVEETLPQKQADEDEIEEDFSDEEFSDDESSLQKNDTEEEEFSEDEFSEDDSSAQEEKTGEEEFSEDEFSDDELSEDEEEFPEEEFTEEENKEV
jgi:flagellar motor switch protein FliM